MTRPRRFADTLARLAPLIGATIALLLGPTMIWAAVNVAFRGLN